MKTIAISVTLAAAVTGLSLLPISMTSVADIQPNAQAVNAAAKAREISRKLAEDSSTLRCWQDGRLLFEERRVSEPVMEDDDDALRFKAQGKDNAALMLIDFGEATCLYKN